jgi:hypothetical protein
MTTVKFSDTNWRLTPWPPLNRTCVSIGAERAVTPEARDRRLQLAGLFLDRLKELESRSAFDWLDEAAERVRSRDLPFTTP